MLVGTAVGMIGAVTAKLLVTATIRPDIVIGLVVGVPSALGMLMIISSTQRWITALGAFILAIAPGWLGVLVLIEVANSA